LLFAEIFSRAYRRKVRVKGYAEQAGTTCIFNTTALRQTMKKILLVDDEESIHLLYREEFEEEGYEVHSALRGTDALEKFKLISPDLVILDINMPDMNGIEVLRQMKEIDPTLPVILSTAYHEYKQDLGAWASDEYIVKSSDLQELKEAVRRHLSK
jgi:DNA-binding response OmpR family regulator